jgi:hypothetical protein
MPALGPYREHLVIAGGMARDLYRYLPGYQELDLEGVETLDLDIALADPLSVIGETRLHDLLVASGLRLQTNDALRERPPFGLVFTPVSGRYYPQALRHPSRRDPHIEFITQVRRASGDSNAHPQGDQLIAYTLNYVDLLLAAPVQVEVPQVGQVRLPHPLAYAVQKMLIRPERQRHGQHYAKDSADAFKVVASLRSVWSAWRPEFHRWRTHAHYGSWIRQALALWKQLFGVDADRGAQEVHAAYPQYDLASISTIMGELMRILE